MTNEERSDFLLRQAKENLGEVHRAWESGSWNRVVRRAQEVVELSLKGLFKLINVEYPKVHDVAPAFENMLREKAIGIEGSIMDEIKEISKALAKDRAPAFYGEVMYGREEAEQAKRGAERIFSLTEDLAEKLREDDS